MTDWGGRAVGHVSEPRIIVIWTQRLGCEGISSRANTRLISLPNATPVKHSVSASAIEW